MALVPEGLDPLLPSQKHLFPKVPERVVSADGFTDFGSRIGDGLAEGFDHGNLLPEGDAEFKGDEVLEAFSGRPGFLAHEGNARGLMLESRIDNGGQEIVGGGKADIVFAGIEQGEILGVAVRIAQGVGEQELERELAEALPLDGSGNMMTDRLGDAFLGRAC